MAGGSCWVDECVGSFWGLIVPMLRCLPVCSCAVLTRKVAPGPQRVPGLYWTELVPTELYRMIVQAMIYWEAYRRTLLQTAMLPRRFNPRSNVVSGKLHYGLIGFCPQRCMWADIRYLGPGTPETNERIIAIPRADRSQGRRRISEYEDPARVTGCSSVTTPSIASASRGEPKNFPKCAWSLKAPNV